MSKSLLMDLSPTLLPFLTYSPQRQNKSSVLRLQITLGYCCRMNSAGTLPMGKNQCMVALIAFLQGVLSNTVTTFLIKDFIWRQYLRRIHRMSDADPSICTQFDKSKYAGMKLLKTLLTFVRNVRVQYWCLTARCSSVMVRQFQPIITEWCRITSLLNL